MIRLQSNPGARDHLPVQIIEKEQPSLRPLPAWVGQDATTEVEDHPERDRGPRGHPTTRERSARDPLAIRRVALGGELLASFGMKLASFILNFLGSNCRLQSSYHCDEGPFTY